MNKEEVYQAIEPRIKEAMQQVLNGTLTNAEVETDINDGEYPHRIRFIIYRRN